ncbi:RsmB/NOP family class I SAM-dependent RNA methyltransferase [Pseudokordiimonas caeni]|uniref:RsmB/NOP family class I SAM-dependent RNA methyltransferase n=1 Tax=Pseudokordiimonas caeni TaxID=2997908 RepID=UPI002811F581|nr:RsmB/NOP family class I SAM-dependent RNA methyltransferase [Pseudokordiimonas caeni]
MTPAARIAAAIELLDEIEKAMASRGAPADAIVASFFRARRYAGSGDRRAVTGLVYGILRRRALLVYMASVAGLEPNARALVIAALKLDSEQLDMFGTEDRFAPAALTAAEEGMSVDVASAPEDARLNIPDWATAGLHARFGDELAPAMAALAETAPLDLRINPLKRVSEKIINNFKNSYELIDFNDYTNISMRSAQHRVLTNEALYRDGQIEVQDVAAQVASLLVGAKLGEQVVDFCAGAGGKSLLMAATMENHGQIHAFDISGKRLDALKERAKRAGAHNIQVKRLPLKDDERSSMQRPLLGRMDRVVVDAPCSGSGTWRRNPDQRWRLDDAALAEQAALQSAILKEASALVKPGGLLVYMTCSLLPAENEAVADAFAAENPDFVRRDFRDFWVGPWLQGAAPSSLALNATDLQLAPHAHATDGFFIAFFERRPGA